MGLVVNVFTDVKLAEKQEITNNTFQVYTLDERWKWKVKNYEYNKIYKGTPQDVHVTYSYGTHMEFRAYLLKLINREDLIDSDGDVDFDKLNQEPNDLPFKELIDFADNEGCLDWESARRIYKDFMKVYKTIPIREFSSYWMDLYRMWMHLLKVATREKSIIVFN